MFLAKELWLKKMLKKEFSEEIVKEILSLPVPEDKVKVNDKVAKWSLVTLFVSNLELPTYLETDQIYSAL